MNAGIDRFNYEISTESVADGEGGIDAVGVYISLQCQYIRISNDIHKPTCQTGVRL